MRNLIVLFLLIVTTKFYGQNNVAHIKELTKTLNTKVPEFMEQKNVPGIAIAVIDNGQAIVKKGYGLSDISNDKTITSQTGFNIGSISKLFTAVGVMKLIEEGKINLDAPVETYIKRWKLPDSKFDKNTVTIRALLNHTAGISVHGYPGFTDKSKLPTLEESLNGDNGPARANEKVEIIIAPQTKFKYSGGGYTILQLAIEEVTGMSFSQFMKKEVFKPLQMKNTSFKISKKVLKKSAIPYDENKKQLPFEYWTAQGAAGLHTTLDDFVLFADDILNNHTILPKSTIDQMIMPTEVSEENYGLGFRILKLGPMTFTGHSGSNTGWQSAFFIDFKTKSGLIMMTNGDHGEQVLRNTLRTWASWKFKR